MSWGKIFGDIYVYIYICIYIQIHIYIYMYIHIGVSKNTGKHPKMDGENNEKPYEQMDDLGGYPPIFGNIHMGVS